MKRIADFLPLPKRQPGAAPDPPEEEVCPVCDGFGAVRHMVPLGHPDFGKRFPCEACLPKRMAEWRLERLKAANLPCGSQHALTFETWEPRKEAAAAFEAAKLFAADKAPHPFLTLSGPCGTGKTHLAAAIAHLWIMEDRGMAWFYQAERLLDELRRGFNREDGAGEETYRLLDLLAGCSMLGLDDLGAHKASDFATVKLNEIVDERYSHARDLDGKIVRRTVVTTNRPLAEHPERIASRLCEGVCIEIKAADWRRRTGGGDDGAGEPAAAGSATKGG